MSMLPIYEKLPSEQGALQMVKVYEELRDISNTYRDFYFALFEFSPRYGHLFKYSFDSQEYQELLVESKRVSAVMANLVSDRDKIKAEDGKELTIPVKFAELVFSVFMKLRSEVHIDDEL